jgi:hypothetical protein
MMKYQKSCSKAINLTTIDHFKGTTTCFLFLRRLRQTPESSDLPMGIHPRILPISQNDSQNIPFETHSRTSHYWKPMTVRDICNIMVTENLTFHEIISPGDAK